VDDGRLVDLRHAHSVLEEVEEFAHGASFLGEVVELLEERRGMATADGEDAVDRGFELELPTAGLGAAEEADAGEVDQVAAVYAKESVGSEETGDLAEGADIAAGAFGAETNAGVVADGLEVVDVVGAHDFAEIVGQVEGETGFGHGVSGVLMNGRFGS